MANEQAPPGPGALVECDRCYRKVPIGDTYPTRTHGYRHVEEYSGIEALLAGIRAQQGRVTSLQQDYAVLVEAHGKVYALCQEQQQRIEEQARYIETVIAERNRERDRNRALTGQVEQLEAVVQLVRDDLQRPSGYPAHNTAAIAAAIRDLGRQTPTREGQEQEER
jgi:hypothetical protein